MKLPTLDHTYYVLRAKGGCEHLAEEELRKGGYCSYVPRFKIWKRSTPTRKRELTPVVLMPGYLFLMTGRGATVAWGEFREERYPHVGKPLCGSLGPLRIDPAIVVQIHVEEVKGVYDDHSKKPKSAKERRKHRIRDLKELFSAMEAADQDKLAA